MRPLAVLLVALTIVGVHAGPALAAWPSSPYVNLAVNTTAADPAGWPEPEIVSDGAGGAIVAWSDKRSGNLDVFAQHVLASGVLDPAWPAAGVALCTAAGDQDRVRLVSDGAGGAIVSWQDFRSGISRDVYALRVRAYGQADSNWQVNGRLLGSADSIQTTPQIVSDGAGGAVVVWVQGQNGPTKLYAQRVLATGALAPGWPVNGRALSTSANYQDTPAAVSDGAGGAIVTWQNNVWSTLDIFAQRVMASGVVDPAWPDSGRVLCNAAENQLFPKIVSDGAGGAIVAWQDLRSLVNYDIYAQRVLANGSVSPGWPSNGRALCTQAQYQSLSNMVPDGAGGAIVFWQDLRNGSWDMYVHHVLASGSVDGAWVADGTPVCTASNDQQDLSCVPDGSGGAIATWWDPRSGTTDIYAQHVLASGAMDPQLPVDGKVLCAAPGGQYTPRSASDGAGGLIVSFTDLRANVADIYAQRLARFGYMGTPEAEIVGVTDVPNDQGGKVKLSWNASYLDPSADPNLSHYDVLRSVPALAAVAMKARGARVLSLTAPGTTLRAGDLVEQTEAGAVYYWEYLTSLAALHYVSGYSYVATTLGDSVANSNPTTAFLVVARNPGGTMYWLSQPASGYSVDNLAPVAPAPFTGQFAGGTTTLHWDPNAEADVVAYRLYRGTSAGFVSGPGTLVAAVPDTGYADAAGLPYYYKLTAVDSHGNESPAATLLPEGTVGVEGAIAPRELTFATPMPNPARTSSLLRFALPRAGTVRLAVYDAAGRLVRELASGARAAGEHTVAWDLRDTGGHAIGAGLYFARFEAEGRALTRRIAVTR